MCEMSGSGLAASTGRLLTTAVILAPVTVLSGSSTEEETTMQAYWCRPRLNPCCRMRQRIQKRGKLPRPRRRDDVRPVVLVENTPWKFSGGANPA